MPVLEAIRAPETTVIIHKIEEAELDEMWSFVGSKKEPRWLWQALAHHTGQVLAYVFGRRKDEVFLDRVLRVNGPVYYWNPYLTNFLSGCQEKRVVPVSTTLLANSNQGEFKDFRSSRHSQLPTKAGAG